MSEPMMPTGDTAATIKRQSDLITSLRAELERKDAALRDHQDEIKCLRDGVAFLGRAYTGTMPHISFTERDDDASAVVSVHFRFGARGVALVLVGDGEIDYARSDAPYGYTDATTPFKVDEDMPEILRAALSAQKEEEA